jgi:hypothetical protein
VRHAAWHFAVSSRRSGLHASAILCGALLPLALGACALGTPSLSTTPTATPGPSLTSTPGIVYQNSLTTAAAGWKNSGACTFGPAGYDVSAAVCYAPVGNLADLDVSVQVTGATNASYGIVFRRASAENLYSFTIDSISKWAFSKCTSDTHTCYKLIDYATNAAIQGGRNAKNTLEVLAIGSHFDFFVNGTKVGQEDDSAFAYGEVGLASSDGVAFFTNITVIRPSPSAQPSPTV